MDLLRKLDGIVVEPNTILGSIDVEALYFSIPHEAGLRAANYFFTSRGAHLQEHNQFVLELMEFVLRNNYFLFCGRFYHQLRGTTMANSCAPTEVNLLLGWWEEAVVFI